MQTSEATPFAPKEVIPHDSPIHSIACPESWGQLEFNEQLYAYYMSRAAWEGSKICWFQRSYESPALLVLFKLIYADGVAHLRDEVIVAHIEEVSDLEWKQMIAYSAAVFQNCGNYKSFGDTKFVPEIHPKKFWAIVKSSRAYKTHHKIINAIIGRISDEIYSERVPLIQIGFPDNEGQSSYYSSNVTSEDAKFVDEFCQANKISPLNTRLMKDAEGNFELKICSRDSDQLPYLKVHTFKDKQIKVTAGDFTLFMKAMVEALEQAWNHTANNKQSKMIKAYIEHFKTGDVDLHKDSQRHWIKDEGPVVETNIGFIETYLDPSGARAEFEGFVSIVDKIVSAKFNTLVDRAEGLIKKLPWDDAFEKDNFTKPDFTNLDIVAFACSGTPIGINIPNYDDIRMTEGFKNVNLGNVYPKPNAGNIQFLSEEDKHFLCKYSNESLTLIVALHELLGHGTGKLFTKDADTGELNYDPAVHKNPFTGEEVSTAYLSTETWSQKFGKLHSGYEECRADTVALHLIHFDEPFEIFYPERKDEWDDIYYTCWLEMLYSGLKGLTFYNVEKQMFGQAHVWAAWVIFAVINEVPDLIKIDFCKNEETGADDFIMTVNRGMLREQGFKALSEFLHKLHVYKSIGDFETAEKFFLHYTKVDETMLKVREIVVANKKPRRIELQPNLFLSKNGLGAEYQGYSEDLEGVITSFTKRWPDAFLADVWYTWVKDAHLVRHPTGIAPFTGSFWDPNHGEGYRHVSVDDAGMCTIVGCDKPGANEWIFKQPVITDENGTSMLVDFSPKGGPKDLLAKWDAQKNGICFPDGNCWVKIQ